MDRSFLSQPQVIAASRQFVCVRLATYEDPLEAKLLKGLVRTGSGEVENTAFCLMSPDGQKLTRGTRGADHLYAGPDAMAADMKRVATQYPPKAEPVSLPRVANARLALDVAAADGVPLVAVVGSDEAGRSKLVERVARLAWDDRFVGRFAYVEATAAELKAVEGVATRTGVVVIAPDKFGQKGTVLRQVGADTPPERLADLLHAAAAEYHAPAKSFQEHVREGHRLGVFWETKVPVTDPMENAARERGRRAGKAKE